MHGWWELEERPYPIKALHHVPEGRYALRHLIASLRSSACCVLSICNCTSLGV